MLAHLFLCFGLGFGLAFKCGKAGDVTPGAGGADSRLDFSDLNNDFYICVFGV